MGSQLLNRIELLALIALVAVLTAAAPSGKRIGRHKHMRDGSPENITEHYQALLQAKNQCGAHQLRTRALRDRIAGGYPANQGEFPSYVQVRSSFGFAASSCGGTIISEWLVVSAFHCFEGQGAGALTTVEVIAGSINNQQGTTYRAKRLCFPNEATRDRDSYDVAILIMSQPIRFNQYVAPACLPYFDVSSSNQAHVVGFGLTSKIPSFATPSRLQVLPVQRTSSCPVFDGAQNTICFISNNPRHSGDACEGDSGGPVYITVQGRQTLVGVVSRGVGTCQAGSRDAGIYMNVFQLNRKINDAVQNCHR